MMSFQVTKVWYVLVVTVCCSLVYEVAKKLSEKRERRKEEGSDNTNRNEGQTEKVVNPTDPLLFFFLPPPC